MNTPAHMATAKDYGIGRAAAETALHLSAEAMNVPGPNALAFVTMGCAKLFWDAHAVIPAQLSADLFRALGDWLATPKDDPAIHDAAGRVSEAINAISLVNIDLGALKQ